MTLPIRILLASIASALAIAFVAPSDARSDDYPTPRLPGARRTAIPAEVAPATAAAPRGSEAEAVRRPKVVRVAAQETIASPAAAPVAQSEPGIVVSRHTTAAPRELPAPAYLPTPRAIQRPNSYSGPKVEPMEAPAQPGRALSHESIEPAPQPEAKSPSDQVTPATTDTNELRVVAKSVSTSRSLPRVKINPVSDSGRASATHPVATTMQPAAQPGTFKPTQADLDRWFTPLNQVGILPQPAPGEMPPDLSGELFAVDDVPRRKDWPEQSFYWEAPEVWHQPYYFDDVPLERYGQSIAPARQAWLSGLKFYMTFPLMPVKLWADPPFTKVATFGYYRVGSDNPAVRQKSMFPHGYGPWGYGYWRGAGAFWDVPPTPAWETTPGAAP